MKHKYRKACFGGTFDVPLHKGHLKLLEKAFSVADFCYIGLMTDNYVNFKRKEGVKDYETREKNLINNLTSMKIPRKRYEIKPLDNFYGPEVLDSKFAIEAMIVSEKTVVGARGINELRRAEKMEPLDIVEIEMVLAKDKKPISSTRLRKKDIDKRGNVRK